MRQFTFIFVTAFVLITAFGNNLKAQKIDSIFFNLYTDSLKKGTFNYINVDAKSSNGNWLPMTAKQMKFTATSGKFDGNSLFIDKDAKEEKVTVTAALISDPAITKSITIYIKKKEDNEKLKTSEEILKEIDQESRQRKRNPSKN